MKSLLKRYFLILILFFNRSIVSADAMQDNDNFLTKSLVLGASGLLFYKLLKGKITRTYDENNQIVDSNDFIDLNPEFEEKLIVCMEQQNENDLLIEDCKKVIREIEQKEAEYLQNLADENNVSNQNLEDAYNRKKEFEFLVKNLQIMPFCRIEGKNNLPSVFQIFHTNELDQTNNASIACGPYSISFLCAMQELINDRTMIISKEALEQYAPMFFHPTHETLDEFDMIQRMNDFKEKYMYYIVNYNNGKKYINKIKNGKALEKEVNFKHRKDRITYRNPEFNDEIQDTSTTEKQLQKNMRQNIINSIKDPNNNIIHFLYRCGEDRGHGHWSYVGYVKNNHPQTGLYYINNVNGFSDETKFVAENLQELVYQATKQ